MKRNSVYVYIAASLSMLIPVPGRFAYGICIFIFFNFVMFTGTLFLHAIRKLNLNSYKTILLTSELIFVTIFAKQILTFISPVISLTLGFLLFLPTLSSVIIGYFFDNTEKSLSDDLKANSVQGGVFSVYALLFFLVRDVFGYGTITFPSSNGMYVINMPFYNANFSVFSFISSIPGALILVSIFLAIFVHITNRIDSIERIQK